MTELNEMIETTLNNAKISNNLSQQTEDSVHQGQEVIARMLQALENIESSNAAIMSVIEESNTEMSHIGNMVGDISAKTNSINEIVFQTKLLSFNASVEAARAGEHGKGFSVVAEEVGLLAQKSGETAKEISDLIGKSQQDVFSIVEKNRSKVGHLILDAKQKLEVGLSVAAQCREIFERIVGGTTEVRTMSENICKASQEQSKGTAEIADAMNRMEQAAAKNRELIRETMQYSETLSEQAEALGDLTKSLNRVVGGEAHHKKAS
jgi:methyl-accepting chemotaxis protein